MIKATELRIGNLIQCHIINNVDGTDEWVDNYVDIDDMHWLANNPHDDYYHPIPLTDGLLVRMGFDGKELIVQPNVFVYHNGSVYVRGMSGAVHPRDIPFVHTLQNFIFAFTGEELTIKDANNETKR